MLGQLVLLRHGQSTWNQLNLFTGWHDVPLSAQGEEEAADAGRVMKEAGLRFDVVSAALYANRLSAETALSELPGELSGQAEIVDRYPPGSTAFTDLGPWNGRRSAPRLAASASRSQARQVADSATAMREAQP